MEQVVVAVPVVLARLLLLLSQDLVEQVFNFQQHSVIQQLQPH